MTTFSVTATGAIACHWERSSDGGTSWTYVTNSGGFSGATTSELTIAGANLDLNGHLFRCVVIGVGNSYVYSDPAVLTVAVTAKSVSIGT